LDNELNWEKSWNDPFKIADIIINNNKIISAVETLRKRLELEKRERKEVKKGHFIYEGKEKSELVRKTADVDSVLARKLEDPGINNEKLIVNVINARMKELKIEIKEYEQKMRKILKEDEMIRGIANAIVHRLIEIIEELRKIYEKQKENMILNDEYDFALKTAIENSAKNGIPLNNLSVLEKEATKCLGRILENKKLQERAVRFNEAIEVLKQKAKNIKEDFQKETSMIQEIKKSLLSFFRQKKEEKMKEKFA